MSEHPSPPEERLRDGIDRSGGPDACWPWIKARDGHGYGTLRIGSRLDGTSRMVGAHVLAYRLADGDPPADKPCILHTCDNPPCCNPKHLWAGTRADNNADSARKGRTVGGKGRKPMHCPAGHPYDETNTHIYRGKRYCRVCRRMTEARRRSRIKAEGANA